MENTIWLNRVETKNGSKIVININEESYWANFEHLEQLKEKNNKNGKWKGVALTKAKKK